MFSLGQVERDESRGHEGGDVQWVGGAGVRSLREISGLGKELWESLAQP